MLYELGPPLSVCLATKLLLLLILHNVMAQTNTVISTGPVIVINIALTPCYLTLDLSNSIASLYPSALVHLSPHFVGMHHHPSQCGPLDPLLYTRTEQKHTHTH